MRKIYLIQSLLTLLAVFYLVSDARSARLKDIIDIIGVRPNQLVGYGLIVGLDGTGDGKKSEFTIQSMARMLEKMGMAVDPKDIAVKNVAAVMVTATLPPFIRKGSRIDVIASSIGDAKNLQGGNLLFTPLKGADGRVYAVAQGPVSIGGFFVEGGGGSVQKNFLTVGRIVGGALIEKEVPMNFTKNGILSLTLRSPDFTTAHRVAGVINNALYDGVAKSRDAGTVQVRIPAEYLGDVVGLITMIEKLEVQQDGVAKVVINERTGTVVMGTNVRISTVAIAHGSLSIQIKENEQVSQPLPFSQGQTVVSPETDISVEEENTRLILVKTGVSIGEVVKALNALGVTPRDLIAIFQAIKAAGALHAKLEII